MIFYDGLYSKIFNFFLENIKFNILIINFFVVFKILKDRYVIDVKVVYLFVLVKD